MSQWIYHFWDGQQLHRVEDTGQTNLDLARAHHMQPCFVEGWPQGGPGRFRRYNYLGWSQLPKSLIPPQLRVLALVTS